MIIVDLQDMRWNSDTLAGGGVAQKKVATQTVLDGVIHALLSAFHPLRRRSHTRRYINFFTKNNGASLHRDLEHTKTRTTTVDLVIDCVC